MADNLNLYESLSIVLKATSTLLFCMIVWGLYKNLDGLDQMKRNEQLQTREIKDLKGQVDLHEMLSKAHLRNSTIRKELYVHYFI